MTEYGKTLRANVTPIPGLMVWELPVHGDNRGWFKENWQREKMVAAGLPDFGPVQNNVSFNDAVGTTRGIHAEPWDKFVSVATGRIFGAWVDLRAGPTFGTVFTAELDPSRAVFVPRGVGNAFQTLEPNTAYIYLVNDHYSPDAAYTSVNLADETVAIDWPIPLERAELSAKDRAHPRLADSQPHSAAQDPGPRRWRTTGPGAPRRCTPTLRTSSSPIVPTSTSRPPISIPRAGGATTTPSSTPPPTPLWTRPRPRTDARRRGPPTSPVLPPWRESPPRTASHSCTSPATTCSTARRNGPYREDDPVTPLGVYGQTKAAGDQIVATVPRHYIVRTSWVIGDGRNFVRTMLSLASAWHQPFRGERPAWTLDVHLGTGPRDPAPHRNARTVRHLQRDRVRDRDVLGGHRAAGVHPRRPRPRQGDRRQHRRVLRVGDWSGAPRPRNSVLDLTRIESTGYEPVDADEALANYVGAQSFSDDRPDYRLSVPVEK